MVKQSWQLRHSAYLLRVLQPELAFSLHLLLVEGRPFSFSLQSTSAGLHLTLQRFIPGCEGQDLLLLLEQLLLRRLHLCCQLHDNNKSRNKKKNIIIIIIIIVTIIIVIIIIVTMIIISLSSS